MGSGLQFRDRWSIISGMQEVLSKTVDPQVPLRAREFYELRLDDSSAFEEPRYIVQQTRIRLNDGCD